MVKLPSVNSAVSPTTKVVSLMVKSTTNGSPSALAALFKTLPETLVSSAKLTTSSASVKSDSGVTTIVKVEVSVFTPSETV